MSSTVAQKTPSIDRALQKEVRLRLRRHWRRRVFYTFALILVCVSLVFGGLFLVKDSLLYFRTPSDLQALPLLTSERMRLGGVVLEESVSHKGAGVWQFEVSDGKASVGVHFSGVLPDLFQEGQGMIAEGYYSGGVFRADMVLAKHDENYTPRSMTGEDLLSAGGKGASQ